MQKKVGTLSKVQATGPFVDEWKRAFGDISKEVEEVEIAPALSMAGFAIKDEAELVSFAREPFVKMLLTPGALAIDEDSFSRLQWADP